MSDEALVSPPASIGFGGILTPMQYARLADILIKPAPRHPKSASSSVRFRAGMCAMSRHFMVALASGGRNIAHVGSTAEISLPAYLTY